MTKTPYKKYNRKRKSIGTYLTETQSNIFHLKYEFFKEDVLHNHPNKFIIVFNKEVSEFFKFPLKEITKKHIHISDLEMMLEEEYLPHYRRQRTHTNLEKFM